MNHQREQFKGKMADHMKRSARGDAKIGNESGSSETRVEHHGDGTHTIHHPDGEKSGPHPSMAHAAMHMAAKHDGGEHGHITPHPGGGATTNHVAMDGQVQEPMDHESEDEGYAHLKGNIGDGAESEGMPMAGGMSNDDTSFE